MIRKSTPVPTVAGCLLIQLCVGILYLWSVFRADVIKSFNWSNAAATMVASYMLMSFVIGNFLGGMLNDKKGPKFTAVSGIVLFALGVGSTGFLTENSINLINFTYCVIGGLGSGFAYAACISCVQKWLPHRRGLASGLAVSAFGLSTVIFSPISKQLMVLFTDNASGLVNFQPVFFILAGVFFIIGLSACSLVRLPDNNYLNSLPNTSGGKNFSNEKNFPLSQAIKTVPFWSIFFLIFFINGTWNLASPIIKDIGISRGLSDAEAIFAVSFTGIANASGRLIMAALSDKIGRTNASLILGALMLAGAICMTFIGGYAYIVIVALLAFAYGGPAAINPATSTDFFGPKYSGTNYGVIMMALGISSIFFNLISSTLLGGQVVPTFVMGAITAILSMVFMLVIDRYLKKMKAS